MIYVMGIKSVFMLVGFICVVMGIKEGIHVFMCIEFISVVSVLYLWM